MNVFSLLDILSPSSAHYQCVLSITDMIVKQRTVPVFNAEIYKFNLWSLHKTRRDEAGQSSIITDVYSSLLKHVMNCLSPIHYSSTLGLREQSFHSSFFKVARLDFLGGIPPKFEH